MFDLMTPKPFDHLSTRTELVSKDIGVPVWSKPDKNTILKIKTSIVNQMRENPRFVSIRYCHRPRQTRANETRRRGVV
jgi:hypothetical protein